MERSTGQEAFARRGTATSLVQVAVANAQIQREKRLTSEGTAPADPDAPDPGLAFRAIQAKRRKSLTMQRGPFSAEPSAVKDNGRAADVFFDIRNRISANGPSKIVTVPSVTTPAASRLVVRRNTWAPASGTSAVAIDNKIEQAMDLVKSHLMFAVREEVEVLKERIAELMERITQLEVENAYLRAHASQDTLSQLSAAAVVVSGGAAVGTAVSVAGERGPAGTQLAQPPSSQGGPV